MGDPKGRAFSDIFDAYLSRRSVVKAGLLTVGTALLGATGRSPLSALPMRGIRDDFSFHEVRHGVDEILHVPPGYEVHVLMRWGDPVLAGAAPFDPAHPKAEHQARQFGYNNDFIAYFPLPKGSLNPRHGLLCVNHEFTNEALMFPAWSVRAASAQAKRERVHTEMAALGASIIEVKRLAEAWRVVPDSPYARRITAHETRMRISGPLAAHPRMKTRDDPGGTRVLGTISNCAGGVTPWGTYLMAEENFDHYFSGSLQGHPEARNYARYGVPKQGSVWGEYDPRWHINREPLEVNRFGWMVEVDPFKQDIAPVKRTALGRFKHEGAKCVVNGDGRVVVYMGDDEAFEYLYRFVSRERFQERAPGSNQDLLDRGTLWVARFGEDGALQWLALRWGELGLTKERGFESQADVLLETRRAADIVGATPMDRPEGIDVNPRNQSVFLSLTNNRGRLLAQVDGANPRAHNRWGHIIELQPPGGDHAAQQYHWDMVVRCGNPADRLTAASWHPETSSQGWFSCPDNLVLDHAGRLWVATDQGKEWPAASGTADGLWGLCTDGALRGKGRMFLRAPVGAEVCGPCFTPDDETLFLSIQHPGADGAESYPGFGRPSTFEQPVTRWPDFVPGRPPRPAVVAITRAGGGRIGM
ncbi:MAG: PhoX family protein [Gammaproteobacteria bacterium]